MPRNTRNTKVVEQPKKEESTKKIVTPPKKRKRLENKKVIKPKRKHVQKKTVERTKKKLKLKRLKTNETANSVANYRLQTMKIETVAHKNLVLMYIKRQNGNQGYTRPIHSAVTKKENEIPDELKEQGLDVCASNNYLFLRKSHEDDSKVKSDSSTANISHYNRTAYCAMPAEKYYETNGDFNEEKIVKQMIASYCELQGKNKKPDEVFTPWNKDADSSTEQPNRYLDHVLTDSSVVEVLKSYFIPKKVPKNEFYNFMVGNKIDGFFSRNKNGKYSSYAIQECGFPDDSDEGDNSEMDEDDNDSGEDFTNDDKDDKEDEDDKDNDLSNAS